MRCADPVRALVLGLVVVALSPVAFAAGATGLAVDVTNESEPVLCAEKDNVAISFSSAEVRSFRIEAAHPVYLSAGMRDNQEADWTACDMSDDPVHAAPAPPRKQTIYEDANLSIVGYAFSTFWRPATATVRIGDRVEKGLHMLQVWMVRPGGAEEVLVFYPPDGHWRARPFAPLQLKATAYGSSFIVGPVQSEARPVANVKDVVFDPAARTFSLSFLDGSRATVRMVSVDEARIVLDISFDRAISGPFATLRSMYVTEFNNDAARIAVRQKGARGWREDNIMKFDHATATDVWVGRLSPSRHNTSSPDFVFNGFSADPAPARGGGRSPPR
jgi:hypothetical protein